ncbi:aldo/keto reductase [Desulfoscipio gibsoniae]|uniref:Putative oxidoreductase of aldo/keto reductase family n=1 Tax=Desulfoscipio gibsoniae DSM 7213 TaxID=767817 RepID=R4KHJ2_9FIRM|nr:aldo/keto reductase [Desulfoscipio gibsoniae]AGL01117.1 putative oxidoreductase of aldo/keto reductase family [Desulfoscipio gibsoniae DSM 7213]
MQYRQLGRTGLDVSVIGFGGIPIQRVSDKEATAIVQRALDKGINFFDTARGYTDSEAKLGAVLKCCRRKVIIATKSMARTKDGMTSDIKKSLATLGVDYIDLYQLHNVKDRAALEQVFKPDGALAALKEAKRAGVVKHIGITGHIRSYLVEALKSGELETVQFPFNAVEASGAEELFEQAKQVGAGIIIMKPLAGGAIRNTNYALRFILEYNVTTVIPGMDSPAQVDENVMPGHELLPLSAVEKKVLEKEAGVLGAAFCRRCEYCQPCPQGIDIPTVFLLDGYYTRYDLKEWARERYWALPNKADACVECGECEEKCPYSLPIRRMLTESSVRLGG